MPAASEDGGHRGRVDRVGPAADDGEDALVHLHEQDERLRVREVDDLVREVGDALDVLGPAHRGDEDLLAGGVHRLERVHEPVQQVPLAGGQRRVQVRGDEILARAVAEAPGEGVGVSLRRRRVGQRPRVLVDPEREDCRLQRRRGELPLGEDPDEGRRQRPVGREHGGVGVHPVRKLDLSVVVEEHLLDARVERDRLELAEPRRARGLDDDQSPDRVELEAVGLDDGVELVRVQAVEVAHVAVERSDRDDRARVELARGEHRRERVEVRVPVGGDDLLGPHGLILPRTTPCGLRRAQVWAIASISTRAPTGSCEMPIVERAGGRSPTWRA